MVLLSSSVDMISRKLSFQHWSSLVAVGFAAVAIAVALLLERSAAVNPFSWYPRDNYDYISEKMSRVNPRNCPYLAEADINLPPTSVGQLPQYNRIPLQGLHFFFQTHLQPSLVII